MQNSFTIKAIMMPKLHFLKKRTIMLKIVQKSSETDLADFSSLWNGEPENTTLMNKVN